MGWGFGDDADDERTLREAANGIDQTRRVSELVRGRLGARSPFQLTPEVLCDLNERAMRGLMKRAGMLRERSDQQITGSRHVPPPHEQVRPLVVEACDFVNGQPGADPLFIAAYVLWRICWIHPFDDGNGRTARAASYLMLSVRLGFELPGELPIPARLKHAPIAYRRALEAADAAWSAGRVDVGEMVRVLAFYLRAQLRDDPPVLPP